MEKKSNSKKRPLKSQELKAIKSIKQIENPKMEALVEAQSDDLIQQMMEAVEAQNSHDRLEVIRKNDDSHIKAKQVLNDWLAMVRRGKSSNVDNAFSLFCLLSQDQWEDFCAIDCLADPFIMDLYSMIDLSIHWLLLLWSSVKDSSDTERKVSVVRLLGRYGFLSLSVLSARQKDRNIKTEMGFIGPSILLIMDSILEEPSLQRTDDDDQDFDFGGLYLDLVKGVMEVVNEGTSHPGNKLARDCLLISYTKGIIKLHESICQIIFFSGMEVHRSIVVYYISELLQISGYSAISAMQFHLSLLKSAVERGVECEEKLIVASELSTSNPSLVSCFLPQLLVIAKCKKGTSRKYLIDIVVNCIVGANSCVADRYSMARILLKMLQDRDALVRVKLLKSISDVIPIIDWADQQDFFVEILSGVGKAILDRTKSVRASALRCIRALIESNPFTKSFDRVSVRKALDSTSDCSLEYEYCNKAIRDMFQDDADQIVSSLRTAFTSNLQGNEILTKLNSLEGILAIGPYMVGNPCGKYRIELVDYESILSTIVPKTGIGLLDGEDVLRRRIASLEQIDAFLNSLYDQVLPNAYSLMREMFDLSTDLYCTESLAAIETLFAGGTTASIQVEWNQLLKLVMSNPGEHGIKKAQSIQDLISKILSVRIAHGVEDENGPLIISDIGRDENYWTNIEKWDIVLRHMQKMNHTLNLNEFISDIINAGHADLSTLRTLCVFADCCSSVFRMNSEVIIGWVYHLLNSSQDNSLEKKLSCLLKIIVRSFGDHDSPFCLFVDELIQNHITEMIYTYRDEVIDLLFRRGCSTLVILSIIEKMEEEVKQDPLKFHGFVLAVSIILSKQSERYRECARARWKSLQSDDMTSEMEEDQIEDYMKQAMESKRENEFEQAFINNLLTQGFFSKYYNLAKQLIQNTELPVYLMRCTIVLCCRYMVLSENIANDVLPLIIDLISRESDLIVSLNAMVTLADMQYVVPVKSESHIDVLFRNLKSSNSSLLRYSSLSLIGDLFLHKIMKSDSGLSKLLEYVADDEDLLYKSQQLILRIVFSDAKNTTQLLYNIIISSSQHHHIHYPRICDTVSDIVETVSNNSFIHTKNDQKELSRSLIRAFVDKPSLLSSACLTKLDCSVIEVSSIEMLKTFIDLNSFDLFNNQRKDSDHLKTIYNMLSSFLKRLKSVSASTLVDEMIESLSNTYSTIANETKTVRKNKNSKRVKVAQQHSKQRSTRDEDADYDSTTINYNQANRNDTASSSNSSITMNLSKHIEQFKQDMLEW